MKNIMRGDILLVKLKKNYLHIQSGIRSCIVVQNDFGNTFSQTLIIVPLTTKMKKINMPVHLAIGLKQMALCESIMTISKKQVIGYIGTLDENVMNRLDNALSISLGLQGRKVYKDKDKAVL